MIVSCGFPSLQYKFGLNAVVVRVRSSCRLAGILSYESDEEPSVGASAKESFLVRVDSLQVTLAKLSAGINVEVVGTKRSGRSTFLAKLDADLTAAGFNTVFIRGISALSAQPLAALQVSSLPIGRVPRTGTVTLAVVAEQLAELVGGKSVILIDDWDDLDDLTRGVVQAVRQRSGVPVAISKRMDRHAGAEPEISPSFEIELGPVRFAELEAALEEKLGGPVVSSLVNEVFVQSGGHIGIAMSLVDSAVKGLHSREGRRAWSGTGDLYNPSLRGSFAALLAGLTPIARGMLGLFSLADRVPLRVAREVADWEVIEELEARGFIKIFGRTEPVIVVHPPVLSTFLRDEMSESRRVRLGEWVAAQDGFEAASSGTLEITPMWDQVSTFASVADGHTRSQKFEAQRIWEADPSPLNAARYIGILLWDSTGEPDYDEVIRRTPEPDRASISLSGAGYLIARASWLAYRVGDLDAAIGLLREVAGQKNEGGRMALAKIVQLQAMLGTIPDGYERLLVSSEGSPAVVNDMLALARAMVCVVRGSTSEARKNLADISIAPAGLIPLQMEFLEKLLDLYEGHIQEVAGFARTKFLQAVEGLDIPIMRAYGWLACMALLYLDDWDGLEEILSPALGVGNTALPGVFQLGILNTAVLVALVRDDACLARRYIAEMDQMKVTDGGLLHQQRDLARARLLVHEGSVSESARLLRSAGDRLWARGARVAAVQCYLFSQEVSFHPELLGQDRERFSQVDGHLLAVDTGHFTAMVDRDVNKLVQLADELEAMGLPGWTMSTLENVLDFQPAAEDDAAAAALELRVRDLKRRVPAVFQLRSHRRFLGVRVSDREWDFIREVVTGASNREIADRLSVSVRTVESSVARIAKKLEVRGRRGIVAWYEAQQGAAVSPARLQGTASARA